MKSPKCISSYVIVVLLFFSFKGFAENTSELDVGDKWRISINFGTQMSGIKSEDFILSNYSPMVDFSTEHWFTKTLALRFGFRGLYYYLINDNSKHSYRYYYCEAVFNTNELFTDYIKNSKRSICIHVGSGYFYNYDYKRPNICANLSVSYNYRFSENFVANATISSIMGWDIYQGDEDILPGLSFGISYILK